MGTMTSSSIPEEKLDKKNICLLQENISFLQNEIRDIQKGSDDLKHIYDASNDPNFRLAVQWNIDQRSDVLAELEAKRNKLSTLLARIMK